MYKKVLIIGIVIFFGIGFLSSGLIKARRLPRTIVAYTTYPLLTDQWFINDELVAVGRGFCKEKPADKTWVVKMVRKAGESGTVTIQTGLSWQVPFPFVGVTSSTPEGYNQGIQVEEARLNPVMAEQFSCPQ